MNRDTPPTVSGIPMLGGFTQYGAELRAEPIMMFDREQNLVGSDTPREQLKYKLEMRHWRADVIEDFLDRLGFKP